MSGQNCCIGHAFVTKENEMMNNEACGEFHVSFIDDFFFSAIAMNMNFLYCQ